MCTLIVVHNVNDRYPLIIGANRDEFYDRPSQGPDLMQVLPVAVIAPKDLRGGGTWIGAAQGGWFVGLTNQDDGDLILGKRSRGEVVRDMLTLGDHREAAKYLSKIDPFDYNPFNLVFGRPGAVFLCRVHHGLAVDLEPIETGVRVVSNDCAGDRYRVRENRAACGAYVWDDDDSEAIVKQLLKTLSSHDGGDDPYQSLCVHDDGRDFGTKSSSIVLVTKDGDIDYFHSEGHPCERSSMPLNRHLMSINFDDLETID